MNSDESKLHVKTSSARTEHLLRRDDGRARAQSFVVGPSYSARLIIPFIRIIEEQGVLSKAVLSYFRSIDPDARISALAVDAMLASAVSLSGDPALGVRACMRTEIGDVGLFDFLIRSAETTRASLVVADRYHRLLHDHARIRVEDAGERAIVQIETQGVLQATAEDFALCGLIRHLAPSWPEGLSSDLDVWFRHPEPRDLGPYREAIADARLHFSAPMTGFGFAKGYLDQPLRSKEPRLYEILVPYAESVLSSLSSTQSVSSSVRDFVRERLVAGAYGLEDAARHLRMSSRTLTRRLADEGTVFTDLVSDERKTTALRYLAGSDLPVARVAELSGFSETPSFFRAFRRWMNMTPLQYRRRYQLQP